jgi:hypothetical protein
MAKAKLQKAPPRRFLDRKAMEEVINQGGSVMHQGEIISKIEDLPTDTDLAIGDPTAESAQMRTIEQQIEALQADKARIARAHADRARAAAAQRAAAEEGDEEKPAKKRKPRRAAGARRGRPPKGESLPTADPGIEDVDDDEEESETEDVDEGDEEEGADESEEAPKAE